ncbi:hypothetical protein [Pseudovibrio sp. WM33]|uniref:hypothetical protein n=1 Tax=Pseudovibrio sp. WM33 TaxID=1735585 RepID=UPI0007AE64D8|nr:hypothetical protein [Pseudovibrio sp. WM33]KZL23796.1 hypothetical protein PsWM33_03085 [Pseudovibrio sp. WM33]
MRPRVAIVGGGVTAGLAASVLSQTNDVIVFRPTDTSASPIPEIVPRRAFFEGAFLGPKEEKRIIRAAASPVCWVAWRNGTKGQKHKATTNSQYFIYDKGRLAKILLDAAPVHYQVEEDIPSIGALTGYPAVLDCRGAKAVAADKAYQTARKGVALTCCTYVIAERPPSLDPETMEFWAETTASGHRRTFYVVPVGGSMVSLGCSSAPSDAFDHAALLEAAARSGLSINESSIRMSGNATPHPTIVHNSLSHVSPLGDARGLPCPLTEYGTLKALSQIAEISGGKRFPTETLRRPISREVDPHIPMELFA